MAGIDVDSGDSRDTNTYGDSHLIDIPNLFPANWRTLRR